MQTKRESPESLRTTAKSVCYGRTTQCGRTAHARPHASRLEGAGGEKRRQAATTEEQKPQERRKDAKDQPLLYSVTMQIGGRCCLRDGMHNRFSRRFPQTWCAVSYQRRCQRGVFVRTVQMSRGDTQMQRMLMCVILYNGAEIFSSAFRTKERMPPSKSQHTHSYRALSISCSVTSASFTF